MIVGRLDTWQQRLDGRAWKLALDYLQGLSPDSPEGDTQLDGESIFGRVMAYETRTPEEGLLEAHREYVDVQTTLEGAEGIEWFPQNGLQVKTPYDETIDRELYYRPGPPEARIDMFPGTFCVLFPEDAHLAQQIVGSARRTIRKAVVKIRLDQLDR